MAAVSDESFVAAVLEELGTDSFWRKVTMEEMDKILCRAEEIERDKPCSLIRHHKDPHPITEAQSVGTIVTTGRLTLVRVIPQL